MARVAQQYPDDADVQTLYSESIMNLRPWKQWKRSGEPETGTLQLVTVLEHVLGSHPDHLGANHYYIHAVKGSQFPERAIPSATFQRNVHFGTASVHLLHGPAHTWYQTGDYSHPITSAQPADSIGRHSPHNLLFLFTAQSMLLDSSATMRVATTLKNDLQGRPPLRTC